MGVGEFLVRARPRNLVRARAHGQKKRCDLFGVGIKGW